MKYGGTIQRVLTTKTITTLILETEIGPRGIELARHDWLHLLRRAGQTEPQALVGWDVEYDPEHDSLDLVDPDETDDAAPEAGPLQDGGET